MMVFHGGFNRISPTKMFFFYGTFAGDLINKHNENLLSICYKPWISWCNTAANMVFFHQQSSFEDFMGYNAVIWICMIYIYIYMYVCNMYIYM
mgnify:CR=1 FL=1